MSKNDKNNLTEYVLKMAEQQEAKALAVRDEFYPNNIIAPFLFSSEQSPLAPLLAQAKAPPDPQAPTQKQLLEFCQLIRSNIELGKPNNMEIQLNKGLQVSDKKCLPLGNTAIKLRINADEPVYFFIKAGDTLRSSVYLSSDCAVGIILIQDENDNDYFLRLSEFYLLSIRENPDPRKESGLMTSFEWLTAKAQSSIICASNLIPIRNLLLSEWLKSEWQRVKDAMDSCNEVSRSDSDG